MGVENRLACSLTNVGANVHGIATSFAFDTIHLLTKKDSKCIQIIAIALSKVIGMSLGYDESVSWCHGIQILNGKVMHVLAARSRPTFSRMLDQATKTTTQIYE